MPKQRKAAKQVVVVQPDEKRNQVEGSLVSKEDLTEFAYVSENSISPRLRCSICTNPFYQPVETECKHHFCTLCFNRLLDAKTVEWKDLLPFDQKLSVPCPVCQVDVKAGDVNLLPSSDMLCLLVNELQVSCPRKKEGCGWSGPREAVQNHLWSSCDHLTCLHQEQGCTEQGSRAHLTQHKAVCGDVAES